jgi:hypothetical protein
MPTKTYLISAVTLTYVTSLLYAGASQNPGKPDLKVAHAQNASTIPAYEVFEITFEHENEYADASFDATIDVVFTSPSKKQMKIGGFHYGSSSGPKIHKQTNGQRQQVTYEFDKHNLWKARFAPAEIGKWTYSFTFTNREGQNASGGGDFLCVKGPTASSDSRRSLMMTPRAKRIWRKSKGSSNTASIDGARMRISGNS